MDRNQAFAFSDCPEDANHDDIIDPARRAPPPSSNSACRRPPPPNNGKLLERALTELERFVPFAMLDPRDPAAGLPGGATIFLKVGTMLADRYVIKERIGTGERAAVFVPRLGPGQGGSPLRCCARCPARARHHGAPRGTSCAGLSLSHPNLAGVYSLGRAEGMTFIAMELVEGETLRQYFERARDRDLGRPG